MVPDWGEGISGFEIGRPDFSEDQADLPRTRYLDQNNCVNSILRKIADLLDGDDIALVKGDHGPDRQNQMFVQATDWTEDQRTERLGTFLATKVPGCDMAEIGSLVNVGRRMMSSLTGDLLPDRPTRTHDMQKSSTGNFVRELETPSL